MAFHVFSLSGISLFQIPDQHPGSARTPGTTLCVLSRPFGADPTGTFARHLYKMGGSFKDQRIAPILCNISPLKSALTKVWHKY